MEGWELWRWKNYGGVGTLKMEKLWRCGNSGDGKNMEVWELWRWKNYWRCEISRDGKIMEVWELFRWKNYGGVGTL